MELIKELERKLTPSGDLRRMGLFLCPVCGGEHKTDIYLGTRSKSCGCKPYNRSGDKNPKYRHGKCGSRIYTTWTGMKNRCNNPLDKNYELYGARGIKVCDEWNKFIPFYEWASANGYKDDLVIDRIDPTKGYSPKNCQWVTVTENSRRRRGVSINMEIARLIRAASATGFKRKEIAEKFGITWAVVSFVLNNQTWKE